MEQRYRELFSLNACSHQEGCPVFADTGILFKDNENGAILAQFIFRNLSQEQVIACKIEIRGYSVNGTPLESTTYQYLDLAAGRNACFGAAISIPLPDLTIRRMDVVIREVVMEPFRVWTCTDDTAHPLPQQEKLETVLGSERNVQYYSALVGKPCVYVPKQEHGLFLCTCGQLMLAEDGACVNCGCTYPQLAEHLDPEAIEAAVTEQLRRDEEARIEAEQAAEAQRLALEAQKAAEDKARKARKKRTGAVIAILLVAVLIAAAVIGYVLPAVRQSQAYDAAAALMEAGDYPAAEAAFLAMGDYEDSAQQALECRYQMAEELLEADDFAGAIANWQALGDYSDSADRIEDAIEARNARDYDNAAALRDSGDYIAAADAFALLEGYRDAADQQAQCLELQKQVGYEAALAALEAGEYLQAMEAFGALADYSDAAEQYIRTAYTYADTLFTNGQYAEAAQFFEIAGDHEDAAARIPECQYQYGCQLIAEGSYSEAIAQLQKCGEYSDAAKKILEAKFGYVNANLDPENLTTYEYLQELVSAKYTGAQQVYKDLYAWKVTVVAFNNNPNDSKTNLSSLSKYQYLCVHFELSGGEPGATTNIRTVLVLPNGQSGSVPHAGCQAGYIGCSYGWYDNPDYGATGTLTFKAYDEAGNLLVTASVQVTN